jgi:hypothetical protein
MLLTGGLERNLFGLINNSSVEQVHYPTWFVQGTGAASKPYPVVLVHQTRGRNREPGQYKLALAVE